MASEATGSVRPYLRPQALSLRVLPKKNPFLAPSTDLLCLKMSIDLCLQVVPILCTRGSDEQQQKIRLSHLYNSIQVPTARQRVNHCH